MSNQIGPSSSTVASTVTTNNFPYGGIAVKPYQENPFIGGGSLGFNPLPLKIYGKMSEVMKDIGPVTKDQKNTAQGYKFRGVDQFVNALHPALVKHGVIMTTNVLERTEAIKEVTRSNGKNGIDKHVAVKVEYRFYAEDGSSVVSTMCGEGVDSGDKATNKAMSAALKYALIQTFSVPTEDMAEADLETPVMGQEVSSSTIKAAEVVQTPSLVDIAAKAEEKKRSSFRTTKPEVKPATPVTQKVEGWE